MQVKRYGVSFSDKWVAASQQNQSCLWLGLDPNPELLPAHLRPKGEPDSNLVASATPQMMAALLDWLGWVIEQTQDHVCAYKPTLGFYLALGSGGLELLEAVLRRVPAGIPVILDAKYADLNSASVLARQAFEVWKVDALTLNPYAGQDLVAPFLLYPHKAVFLLCRTSNPGANAIQDYPAEAIAGQQEGMESVEPLHLNLVKQCRHWGTPEQVALEVGSTHPSVMGRIRAAAPERLILARSLWGEGVDWQACLQAGLNAHGEGLLLPVPQDWLARQDLKEAVSQLRETVETARSQKGQSGSGSACTLWMPDVCLLQPNPHTDLILELYDIGCILFGDYVQASGQTLPYYIDLRTIISKPQIFHRVLKAYAEILEILSFDRIAGIPYGSLPTATGLSLRLNKPMIYPRKEVKAHGTRRQIEGSYQPAETVVVVDDVLITGRSAMEGAEKLRAAGLKVEDIVVLIDHEQGARERLQEQGYRGHAVLTLSEIKTTLFRAGRIDEAQFNRLSQPSPPAPLPKGEGS